MTSVLPTYLNFLAGGGEMGRLIRAHDWSATPLGAPEVWPQSLKTAVRIMLTSRQPMWVGWGPDLVYLYNDAYFSIIGGRHPAALGSTFLAVWPELRDSVGALLTSAFEGPEGVFREDELLIMERNGYAEETYYTFSFSQIPDDDGRPGGLICVNAEETGRVVGERQTGLLRQISAATIEARSWRDVCTHAATGIGLDSRDLVFAALYARGRGEPDFTRAALTGIDPDHAAVPAVLAADGSAPWPVLAALTDCDPHLVPDPESRIGAPLPSGIHDKPCHMAVLSILPARGESEREVLLLAGLNPYRLFDASYRRFFALLCEQIGAAIANADAYEVVERREADLRHLNAMLEERVTAEVAERLRAEDALRQAHKMEAVGRLTGGIAHDFNNLLTVILGGLDTLQRAHLAEDGRAARALEMAMQGAQRAASLTSRLLAFSRQQPLDPRPTELDQLIFAMSEILHRTLGEQIILEAVLPPDLWMVEVDHNQLESALLNLAVNARDAMDDGGRLTIAAKNTVLEGGDQPFRIEPGDYVAIAISDTGHGMARETVARAFDPFFTTKGVGQGTGLGLSMVYGFAKQSGGHITIDSAVGRGTTVTLYFPRHHGEAPPIPATPDYHAPHAKEGEVVLVVEDNDEVRLYSTSILAELGYSVLVAVNGLEALAVIGEENRRIDLLFTDVMLPGMSGKAIADQALILRPDLKVLFATGYSRDAIVHHGRVDAGVNLLLKPFTYEQVATRVREILDR